MFKFEANKIPKKPGVYIFKDEKSNIVYIGKAKNLKNRVTSYFVKNDDRIYKKHLIVDSIFDIETIITNSEKEALILESNLIKKYKPKYNVLLKDNSEYCFLRIEDNSKLYIPEISIVRRKTEKDLEGEKKERSVIYFGPYTSKRDLLNILRTISKIFPYQCLKIKNLNKKFKENKDEKIILSPCFNYHIKRCGGICSGEITRDEYREIIKNIVNFFSGKIKELSEYLNMKMVEFSDNKNYEQALRYRDRISILESVIDKQYARGVDIGDIEILSIYFYNNLAVINVFTIKNGVLLNKKNFIMQLNEFKVFYEDPDEYKQKVLEEFISQNYINELTIENKKEFVVYDDKYFDKELLSSININVRKYKNKSENNLIELGEENLISYINKNQINYAVLEKIQNKLDLEKIPKRIECFDISNIQGKFAVGSMSVFVDALPRKDQYRKFKIRLKNEPNDVMMMREVLGRRLSKKNLDEWGSPDLIVIDGGLPQLGAVLKIVEEIKNKDQNLKNIINKINIVSLAKREEEIFYLKDGNIKKVAAKNLYVLRQIRDEAHRFGITYFRSRYRKQFLK